MEAQSPHVSALILKPMAPKFFLSIVILYCWLQRLLVWEELVQSLLITAAGRWTSADNQYFKTNYFSSLSQNKTWQIYLLIPNLHVGNTWVRCTIYPDTKRDLMACFASPANEWLDALPSQWLHAHWHRLWGWQPVGIVIPWCKVTNIVDVAEHEGHGAETSKTAPSSTYRVRQSKSFLYQLYSNSLRIVLVDPSSPSWEYTASAIRVSHGGKKTSLLHFGLQSFVLNYNMHLLEIAGLSMQSPSSSRKSPRLLWLQRT